MKATRGYEDHYAGYAFESLGDFFVEFETYCEGRYASLNIPVWVQFESGADNETPEDLIKVGVFMPRHGECVIWIIPGTEDDMMLIRQRMLSIWASRADTGFAR